jgi:hypothetical protein
VTCAVAQIVVFYDVFDANKLLLARSDFPGQFVEVSVCLAAADGELVMVVAVTGDEIDDDLVGDHVLPVCAGQGGAVFEHHLGAGEVGAGLLDEVLDLGMLSSYSRRGRG